MTRQLAGSERFDAAEGGRLRRARGRMTAFCAAVLGLLCPAAARTEGNEALRVGFIVPLSGDLAEFGEAIRNAVILASETDPRVMEAMTPVFEDSRYDSRAALTSLQKLRTADRVHAVYVFGGPMSDSLAPVAEQAGMPMFSTEYDVRYTRGRRYVMRFANNAADYARALLGELRRRGAETFGIIKVENQYHNTLSHALLEQLESSETGDLISDVMPGESDFRATLARLASRRYDALGVYLTPGMQNVFMKQLRSSGIRMQLFGSDSFESREENRGVEDVVEGALYANSAVSAAFVERYRLRFGRASQIVHAALAYEFVLLAAELFSGGAPQGPDELVSRFALSSGRMGVCGRYFYRNTAAAGQYFSFPIAVREIRSGEPRVLSVQAAP